MSIYEEKYYGYYLPLVNSDGSVVGMLFVGKQQKEVNGKVDHVINQIIIIGFIVLILAAFFSVCFTRSIVTSINTMMEFLER